ncbi:MAG: type IX secretion system membrane protein PorP/SprF [Candidatus Firestonebacteria bacterium]
MTEIFDMKTIAIVIGMLVLAGVGEGAFDTKPGIRGLGMGQAYVSIADDTSAMFWNPAGLGGINNMQVEMMYAKKYLGIDDDNLSDWYLGYVLPIGEIGSIGVGDLLFTSGKYKENTGVISYGKQLGNISCGVSIKLMSVMYEENEYTRLDPLFNTYGYNKTKIGIDAGIIYQVLNEMQVGASVENANKPNMTLGNVSGEELPMIIRIGSSYRIGNFTPAIDASYRDRNINGKKDVNVYGGVEYIVGQASIVGQHDFVLKQNHHLSELSIRAGANLDEVSLGASYNFISAMKLDYAFIYPWTAIKGILGSHRFGLTWQL